MATRTFRGYIDGDWNKAGNWLEGAVPVNGDDVVFDEYSPNCYLTANAPISGQLRSLIMTNYTGTIDINGFLLSLFSVGFDGIAFDCGSNSTWINSNQNDIGRIIFYGRANSSYPNYCRIIGNNPTLANIDVQFANSNLANVLNSDLYCRKIKIINPSSIYVYNYPTTNPYTIHCYGGAVLATDIVRTGYFLYFHGLVTYQNIIFYNNSTIEGLLTILSIVKNSVSINFKGQHQLSNNLLISMIGSPAANHNITVENKITSENYWLRILTRKTDYMGYGYNLDVNEIDNISLICNSQSPVYIKNLNVNKRLHVHSDAFDYYNGLKSYYGSGIKVNVNLGNNCKYLISHTKLQDIQFNKPIKSFYCTLVNCENINNTEYPEVLVTVT